MTTPDADEVVAALNESAGYRRWVLDRVQTGCMVFVDATGCLCSRGRATEKWPLCALHLGMLQREAIEAHYRC